MEVTISSNVTATDVAAVQEDVVVDVLVLVLVLVAVPVAVAVVVAVVVAVPLPLPDVGVWLVGHEPVEAVENVPIADVEEHVAGRLEALGSPQEYGTTPARRAAAVKKAAYDQVRSYAERGVPLDRENCSDNDPLLCAYVATTLT